MALDAAILAALPDSGKISRETIGTPELGGLTQHRTKSTTLSSPSWCAACKNFLWGLQAQECRLCQELLCAACAESEGGCAAFKTDSGADILSNEAVLRKHPEGHLLLEEAARIRCANGSISNLEGAKLFKNLGSARLQRRDKKGALAAYRAAKAIYIEISSLETSSGAGLLWNLGLLEEQVGRNVEALKIYTQAIAILETVDDLDSDLGEKLLKVIGRLRKQHRDYEGCYNAWTASREIRARRGTLHSLSSVRLLVGLVEVCGNLGLFQEAEEAYCEGFKILQQLNETTSAEHASLLHSIGEARYLQGQQHWEAALEAIAESLSISKSCADHDPDIVEQLARLGTLQCEMGALDEAESTLIRAQEYLSKATKTSSRSKTQPEALAIIVKTAFGRLQAMRGDFERAVSSYSEALELCRLHDSSEATVEAAAVYRQLGEVYKAQEDWHAAQENYLQAVQQYRQLGLRNSTEMARLLVDLGVAQLLSQQPDAHRTFAAASDVFQQDSNSRRYEEAASLATELAALAKRLRSAARTGDALTAWSGVAILLETSPHQKQTQTQKQKKQQQPSLLLAARASQQVGDLLLVLSSSAKLRASQHKNQEQTQHQHQSESQQQQDQHIHHRREAEKAYEKCLSILQSLEEEEEESAAAAAAAERGAEGGDEEQEEDEEEEGGGEGEGEKYLEVADLMAEVWQSLGMLRRDARSYDGALKALLEARKTREKYGTLATPKGGHLVMQIGTTKGLLNDLNGKLNMYTEALQLFERANCIVSDEGATLYNNIGNAQREYGDLAASLSAYEEGKRIRDRLGTLRSPGGAGLLNNIAALHGQRGDLKMALKVYREALEIRQDGGSLNTVAGAELLMNMGGAHQDLKEYEAAEQEYTQALEVYSRLNMLDRPNAEVLRKRLEELQKVRPAVSSGRCS